MTGAANIAQRRARNLTGGAKSLPRGPKNAVEVRRQMNEVLKSEQGSELAELEFDALWKDKSKADKYSEYMEVIKASVTPEEFRGYCKGTIIGNLRYRCDEDGLDALEEAKDCIDWLIKSVKESL